MSSALELESIETSSASSSESASDASPSALSLPEHARILLAQENADSCEQSKTLFRQAGWAAKLHRVASIEDLQEALQQNEWDLLVCFADSEAFAPAAVAKALQSLERTQQPSAIYVDTNHCATNAAQIIRCGFSDYLTVEESERFVFSAAREVTAKQNQRIASVSESVLAEAHAKSQLLLDSTADAIAYVADGMLIHANQPLCDLLGYETGEELELQPLIDMVSGDDQDKIRSTIKQMNAGEQASLEPLPINALNASGESIAVTCHFDSATHDGEACTQVILRSDAAPVGQPAAATPASAPAETSASSANSSIIDTIENLQGKGLVGFVSFSKAAKIRQTIGFYQYHKLIQEIEATITAQLPETALTGTYLAENWLFAVPEESENAVDANALGEALCTAIDKYLQTATGVTDATFTALGIAKYGIADVIAAAAIDKAFLQCAELAQGSGGYKLFAPRIDNAEGSAALKSALELDRLVARYQPVVGLQNQSSQNYQAHVYMRNDAGQENSASSLVEGLGLESDNVALDRWLVSQAIASLAESVMESPELCLALPLTAAAIVDNDFYPWLESEFVASGLDSKHLAFEFAVENFHDYEQPTTLLFTRLRSKGFPVCISSVGPADCQLVSSMRPDLVKLDSKLTINLNAEEEEENSREDLKKVISDIAGEQIPTVATGISSASELAQLWQTSVPFVQGDYLQAPLSAMNYEFSDIV